MISRRVTAIVLVASSAVLVPTAAAPAQEAVRRASLVLVSESPLVIRGRGFRPAERVTVRLHVADRTYSKRLRAGPTGVFTARFAAVAVADDCKPLSVVATGAAGSRAGVTRKIQIPPACGIAEQP